MYIYLYIYIYIYMRMYIYIYMNLCVHSTSSYSPICLSTSSSSTHPKHFLQHFFDLQHHILTLTFYVETKFYISKEVLHIIL